MIGGGGRFTEWKPGRIYFKLISERSMKLISTTLTVGGGATVRVVSSRVPTSSPAIGPWPIPGGIVIIASLAHQSIDHIASHM